MTDSAVDPTEEVFAYGSLCLQPVQRSVLGRVLSGDPDALYGFVKVTVHLDGRNWPNLRPFDNHHVKGLVFRVTPEELSQIDEYEGPPYRRVRARLESGREAWVYFVPVEET